MAANDNVGSGIKEYKEGDIVFLEYEPGDKFYLVKSGSVKIVNMVSGIEKTVGIITESNFFGEMAILEEAPRNASAIANEDSILIEFKRDDFESIMTNTPMLALKILRTFSMRIFNTKKRLQILKIKEPEFRICGCFLLFADMNNIKKEQFSKAQVFDTTAEDIASWCALSLSETNHVLLRLLKLDKIKIESQSITVSNLDEFQRIVNKKIRSMQPEH